MLLLKQLWLMLAMPTESRATTWLGVKPAQHKHFLQFVSLFRGIAMNFLFDPKQDAPKLTPVELSGKASLEAFRTLLMRYLASEVPELEKKQ